MTRPKINPEKNKLRKVAREILNNFSEEDHKQRSSLLVQNLADYLNRNFPSARRIATYSAMPHEADLSLLPSLLADRQFLFPLVLNDEEMKFHLVTDAKTLTPGFFGIAEPNPQIHPPVESEDIDLVLVPGLAFDLRGHRLGQGLGYYDRFLQETPTIPTFGITYGSQLIQTVPTEPHDRIMSFLASNRGVIPV